MSHEEPTHGSQVIQSDGGIGRVEKILKRTSTTEVKGIFWQIPRSSGDKEVSLKLGRYEKDTWNPFRRASNEITLSEEELMAVIDFITENYRPLKAGESKWLPVTDEAIQKYLEENPDILYKLSKEKLTSQDVTALGYRKKQLNIFRQLLDSKEAFERYRVHFSIADGNEKVWQFFFEKNPWIFGYGLNYIFSSPLEGRKLKQVIAGFDFTKHGKEVDALLKTSGLISSICLVEIKTATTDLLGGEYRNTWKPGEDLAGGVQQLRGYARQTLKNLESVDVVNDEGDPTGEKLYTYTPRACLVIGSLDEFCTEQGVNRDKFFAFEAFRKGQLDVEVVTFDELMNRAISIVEHGEIPVTDSKRT